jgi:hypothetical protein
MENQNEIKKDSGAGPIIGSIIIIILIVLGGLYFLSYVKDQNNKLIKNPETSPEQATDIEDTSDPELIQINEELNTSDINNIDDELNQIDAEIDAAIQ